MPVWGGPTDPKYTGIRASKPPDGGGGLKTAWFAAEMTQAVKTTTAPTGGENICGAGAIYSPELESLFCGEL
jgi:hypothetical protein